VLSYRQHQFLQAFIDGVDAAPPDASPLEVIASSLRAAASLFPDERCPNSRTRQFAIDQNPALQERELHKLAGLAIAVAESLRARGIGEPAATLAAESGTTVFGIAFARALRHHRPGDGVEGTAMSLNSGPVVGRLLSPASSSWVSAHGEHSNRALPR
jgi:hypothetical protein